MKRNKISAALFICMVAVGSGVFFGVGNFGNEQSDDPARPSVTAEEEQIPLPAPESDGADVLIKDQGSADKYLFKSGGSERLAELKETRRRLGFVDERDREVYESYSASTLKSMGESGDITALTVLGGIYYENGQPAKAEPVFEKAAMLGSTSAPLTLGTVQIVVATGLSEVARGDSDNNREQLLQGIAWLEFASLRGEPRGKDKIARLLKDNNISLTSEERKSVEQRAHELYRKLSMERERRGLGPFDHSHVELLNSFEGGGMGSAGKLANALP